MPGEPATIHATAVLVGAKAVLIRGPSGSGKSGLAFDLIHSRAVPFSRMVGDDRVHVAVANGRLMVRPAANLAGLIEVRGLGIRRVDYEPLAQIGLIVDLAAADAARMPGHSSGETTVLGVTLPRLPVAAGHVALPLLLAWLDTVPDLSSAQI